MSLQEKDDGLRLLAEILPAISAQLRGSLGNLHLAFSRIATPEQRALDAELDRNAAILQQSYFRLLRLAGNLTCASRLMSSVPLPLQNLDVTALAESVYHECRPLAEQTGHALVFHNAPAPIVVALHRESVQRVLLHLISNALALNLLGDGLRDALDPKTRGKY